MAPLGLAQWRPMTDSALLAASDLPLMQGLAQRVTALRPDLISAGASYGEPAWIYGKGHAAQGHTWRRQLWFTGAELTAWAWGVPPPPGHA